MRFYLGAPPGWLELDLAALTRDATGRHEPHVPLFVSDYQLRGRRTLPVASGPWGLDSGAFSILASGGAFDSPRVYAARVARYATEIGQLAWCAPQDWMTEPFITAKTGLTVAEHLRRTVANFVVLRDLLGPLVVPVVQGWSVPDDYLRCVDLYHRAGVDLAAEPLVGLGSVCRRQATGQIDLIASTLAARGLRLHGFRGQDQGVGELRRRPGIRRLVRLVVPGTAGRPLHPRPRRGVGGQLPTVRAGLAAPANRRPRPPAGRPAAARRRPVHRSLTGVC